MSKGAKVNTDDDEQFKASIEIEDSLNSRQGEKQHATRHDEHKDEKKRHQITFVEALIHLFKAGIGPGKILNQHHFNTK